MEILFDIPGNTNRCSLEPISDCFHVKTLSCSPFISLIDTVAVMKDYFISDNTLIDCSCCCSDESYIIYNNTFIDCCYCCSDEGLFYLHNTLFDYSCCCGDEN